MCEMICAPCAASPMSTRHVAAGNRRARLLEVLVPADVIRMAVRVDDVAQRPLRQRADGGQDLVRQRRVLRVHEQHALGADLHGHVAAGADEHVDVALRLLQLIFDVVEILLLRATTGAAAERGERDDDERDVEPGARHFLAPSFAAASAFSIAASFFRYSGYIVSAPPRAASCGIPCAFAYSVRNGFVPGR